VVESPKTEGVNPTLANRENFEINVIKANCSKKARDFVLEHVFRVSLMFGIEVLGAYPKSGEP